MEDTQKKYTDSIFYEIFLTAKYIKKMSERLFKDLNLALSSEEFSTLDIVFENKNNICQRDLAVRMLINRANMGKILNSLEEKGYIKRSLDTRHNRPVKLVAMTPDGEKNYLDTLKILRKTAESAVAKITEEESQTTIASLKKIRNILKEIVGTGI